MSSQKISEGKEEYKEGKIITPPIFPLDIIFLSFATLTILIISTLASLFLENKRIKSPIPVRVNLKQDLTMITVPDNWKTYTNMDYNFTFRFPENWTYSLEGPNAAMIDLQNGKSITGSVQPSFNTIDFFNPFIDKELSISIYPAYKNDLSRDQFENGYLYSYGLCDLRWEFDPSGMDLLNIKNHIFLRVQGNEKSDISLNLPTKNIVCYYVNSNTGNLIVLSAIPSSKVSDFSIYDQIISTFQFTK